MKLPSFAFLLESAIHATRRFPLAVAAALAGTAFMLSFIGQYPVEEPLLKGFMLSLLALPIFVGWHTFAEGSGTSAVFRFGLLVFLSAGLVVYAFFLHPNAEHFEYTGLMRYFVLLIVAHLWVSVSPYLNNRQVSDFWEYNRDLFTNFIIGAAYTLILFAGLSAALLAIDQLFDFKIDGDNYLRLFTVLAGVFNTFFFLHHFPQSYEFETRDTEINFVFKTLCLYILMPIVALYFLILYAYGFKILLSGELPKGWVSSLVIGFSIAGIFTLLLSFQLPRLIRERWANLYLKFFWYVLVPLTALLFVAIYRRISDYGVTEERYFVVATGIWLAVVSLYFIISKKDNIKFIPISLAFFALFSAFGPFNAIQTSLRSQVRQLQEFMAGKGAWDGSWFKPAPETITGEEADRVYSILRWLSVREALPLLDPHIPGGLNSAVGSQSGTDYFQLARWFNTRNGTLNEQPVEITVESLWSTSAGPFDINGYGTFYRIAISEYDAAEPESRTFYTLDNTRRVLVLNEKTADAGAREISRFDLTPVLKALEEKKGDGHIVLRDIDFYLLENPSNALKLHIINAAIKSGAQGYYFSSLNALVFSKRKNTRIK